MAKQTSPYQGGGDKKEVSFEKTTYAELPHKFEAHPISQLVSF
jgi:cysteine desulfurase/selenocysteine lyase